MNKTTASRFNALIEKKVGLPVSFIRQMCAEEIPRHIEKEQKASIQLSDTDGALSYRGNMLLSEGHIISDIDAEFNKTFAGNGRRQTECNRV